jgi:hypothetical protein
LRTAIIDDWNANLNFESGFSGELKRKETHFILETSLLSEKLILSKKKRRIPLEKRSEKNSRIGQEIEDLLGIFFFYSFSCCVAI